MCVHQPSSTHLEKRLVSASIVGSFHSVSAFSRQRLWSVRRQSSRRGRRAGSTFLFGFGLCWWWGCGDGVIRPWPVGRGDRHIYMCIPKPKNVTLAKSSSEKNRSSVSTSCRHSTSCSFLHMNGRSVKAIGSGIRCSPSIQTQPRPTHSNTPWASCSETPRATRAAPTPSPARRRRGGPVPGTGGGRRRGARGSAVLGLF